jgi:hypothetical protein
MGCEVLLGPVGVHTVLPSVVNLDEIEPVWLEVVGSIVHQNREL